MLLCDCTTVRPDSTGNIDHLCVELILLQKSVLKCLGAQKSARSFLGWFHRDFRRERDLTEHVGRRVVLIPRTCTRTVCSKGSSFVSTQRFACLATSRLHSRRLFVCGPLGRARYPASRTGTTEVPRASCPAQQQHCRYDASCERST